MTRSEDIRPLLDRLDRHLEAAVALRHRLHADPRVSGQEQDTAASVVAALGRADEPWVAGGALVRVGPDEGPVVALRAEMDALPVEEQTDVPWRSTNGAMHACGHDVHLAAAYAVARTLEEVAGPLPLLLVLQPREESYPSGGADMAASAGLADHDVRAFLGAHVQPRIPDGHFSATPGAVNAAADQFSVAVTGRPGHAAYPHLTADPVVASADLVGTLQHLISRRVDPTHPTVLTIGTIEGGNSPNVVPAAVRMAGTLRTFDEHDRTMLHRALAETAEAVAEVHGCDAEVGVTRGAPVLDNDAQLTTSVVPWLEWAGLRPSAAVRSCGADDFSFYCERFPSLMVFVGVGTGGADQPGLHHPRFLPPDDTVGEVARAMLGGYLGACALVTGSGPPG
jgi:amidohydrolase